MSITNAELKRRLADRIFQSVTEGLTTFEPVTEGEAYPVEITRISRLLLQVKVIPPQGPPRVYTVQLREFI